MSVIRVSKKTAYVVMNTTALNDTRLSFRAKGLHAYLMSKPDDWKVYIVQLESQSPREGREAIRSAIAELKQAGYLSREMVRDTKGRLAGWETTVYEMPTYVVESGAAPAVEWHLVSAPRDPLPPAPPVEAEEAPPPSPRVAHRRPLTPPAAHRCPEGYIPSASVRAWALEKYPQIDFDEALEAMRDYEFTKGRRDWDATLRNWIRTEGKMTLAGRPFKQPTRAALQARANDQSNQELEDLALGRDTHNSIWAAPRCDGAGVPPDTQPRSQGSILTRLGRPPS